MFKTLLSLLLMFPICVLAQGLTFEINYNGQQGQVTITPDGKPRVSSNEFSTDFIKSLESSLAGVKVHLGSIQSAQATIINQITNSLNVVPKVRFSQAASMDDPFIRNQHEKKIKFESELAKDIYRPRFNSSFLNKKIDFDMTLPGDRDALKIYRDAHSAMHIQLGENERYHEATFTKNVIELRQASKGMHPEDLMAFSGLAKGVISNDRSTVLTSMKWLLNGQEFQKGFASSLANNFNPLSFLYPLDANCETKWCKAGELLGDATSMLIGGYEIMNGAIMMIGGGGMTLAFAGAAPSTGGLSALALPATAGAALAGIAMAGHGLSTIGNAFHSLYKNIETPQNINALEESTKLIDETGITVASKKQLQKNSSYETIKDFYRTLKDKEISSQYKKNLIRSFDLKHISVEILKKDRIVTRWHNNDEFAGMFGRFVSPEKISIPEKARHLLALPESNRMLYLDTYILKKGSKVFKGKVAPLNGHPGGGEQYYITSDILTSLIKQ
jgi:hypothetical protein